VTVAFNFTTECTVVSFIIYNVMTFVQAMETSLYLIIFMLIIDSGFTRAGKQNRRSMVELVCNSGSNMKEAGIGT
jgi:hypothetical protein